MSAEQKTSTPELREMIARAQEAARIQRELRKSAPDISTRSRRKTVPQKVLLEKYARRDGFEKNDASGGYHYMFGDRVLRSIYPDQAYEPVLDNGKQVNYHGDEMWKKPMDLYDDFLQEAVDADQQRMNRRSAEEDAAASAGVQISKVEGSAKPGTKEFEELQKELDKA